MELIIDSVVIVPTSKLDRLGYQIKQAYNTRLILFKYMMTQIKSLHVQIITAN